MASAALVRPPGQSASGGTPMDALISLSQSRRVGAASARAKCHAARLDHRSGSYSTSSAGQPSAGGRTGRAT